VIIVTENGSLALAHLDVFVGEWVLEARFPGTFSQDENTIGGAWEKRFGGADWEHDFDLIYGRAN
jgi:hypothetical protein